MTKQKTKRVRTVKVKAWAIYNTDSVDYFGIWGTGGVAVSPMQIFYNKKRAEFTRDLSIHEEEVKRGTTKIIPIEITYKLNNK